MTIAFFSQDSGKLLIQGLHISEYGKKKKKKKLYPDANLTSIIDFSFLMVNIFLEIIP